MMASSAYFDGGRLIKLNLDPIRDEAALAIFDRFGPECRSRCLNSSATISGIVKCKLPRADSILSIFRQRDRSKNHHKAGIAYYLQYPDETYQ